MRMMVTMIMIILLTLLTMMMMLIWHSSDIVPYMHPIEGIVGYHRVGRGGSWAIGQPPPPHYLFAMPIALRVTHPKLNLHGARLFKRP